MPPGRDLATRTGSLTSCVSSNSGEAWVRACVLVGDGVASVGVCGDPCAARAIVTQLVTHLTRADRRIRGGPV